MKDSWHYTRSHNQEKKITKLFAMPRTQEEKKYPIFKLFLSVFPFQGITYKHFSSYTHFNKQDILFQLVIHHLIR